MWLLRDAFGTSLDTSSSSLLSHNLPTHRTAQKTQSHFLLLKFDLLKKNVPCIDFLVVRFTDSKICTCGNLGNSDLEVSGLCVPANTDIFNDKNIATYVQGNNGLEQMWWHGYYLRFYVVTYHWMIHARSSHTKRLILHFSRLQATWAIMTRRDIYI